MGLSRAGPKGWNRASGASLIMRVPFARKDAGPAYQAGSLADMARFVPWPGPRLGLCRSAGGTWPSARGVQRVFTMPAALRADLSPRLVARLSCLEQCSDVL